MLIKIQPDATVCRYLFIYLEESVRRERIIVCRNNDAECYELLHKTYDLNLST